MNLPFDSCYAAISELQTSALEKLKQRDRYKESGLATFKIKVLNVNKSPKIFTQECLLSTFGSDFKSIIACILEIQAERFYYKDLNVSQSFILNFRIKLICNGIVIKDEENLSNQGLKNGSQVLVIVLNETPKEIQESESRIRELETIKADTQLLSSDDGYYMQV